MNDLTQFYVNRLLNQLSSDCSSAQARIRTATTMRAVKFAASVQANAMIRSLPDVRQEQYRVHDCAEKRMEVLLEQQLNALYGCQSSEQLRQEHGRLVCNDWIFLRGEFGRLYGRADREYHRLLHKHVQREKEVAPAPPPFAVAPDAPDDHDDSAPTP
jgi:hypothetical protein